MTEIPSSADRLSKPGAFLSRSDLRELGLERRGLDAIFRGANASGLDQLNTVAEVACFVKVSRRTIERAIKTGELRVIRAGAAVRITDDAVWTWLHREQPSRLSSPTQHTKEEDRDD